MYAHCIPFDPTFTLNLGNSLIKAERENDFHVEKSYFSFLYSFILEHKRNGSMNLKL